MPPRIQINKRRRATTRNGASPPVRRNDKERNDSSSESKEEEETTIAKVSARATSSQLHVMTSLLSRIKRDASAAMSRESSAVATIHKAAPTTATKVQSSPISQH